MDIPPPGAERLKYGTAIYRLGVVVETLSWATGLKPSHVAAALALAFLVAFGSAVTGAVLLLASRSQQRLRPGDAAYGPVSVDESRLDAERRAEEDRGVRKAPDSTRFAGHGPIGAGTGSSSGLWPGSPAGGPAGAGSAGGAAAPGGSATSRKLPLYGGGLGGAAGAEGHARQGEADGGSRKDARPGAKKGETRADTWKPEFRRAQLTDLRTNDSRIQAQPLSQVAATGKTSQPEDGRGAGGADGGGAHGSDGKGPTPMSKIPDVGDGRAVARTDAKGLEPKPSHGLSAEQPRPDGVPGQFKLSEPSAGSQDSKTGGKDWEIYLDKTKAHDLPDGPGVHPDETTQIGPK